MARDRTPGRRSTTAALMTGCAAAALLTAMPRAASAQSFNGTPTVVAGDALVTTGPGTTDVQVYLPETVINWYSFADVDPNAINFQPAGTTATFTGGANIGDYTVLNRILPLNGNSLPTAATVAFNGTVNSTLFGGAQGGNIWFYSPTGIIAGPTATFNVGSLILTTDDIQFVPGVPDISNGSIYGPGGLVQFRGGAGSTGFVDIQPGAKITANAANSYVALVAPRVQQGGTVSANGSIGYVGAEQVDMTINAGLYDISILAGTTDPNGVVHTGTTTGSASTGYLDRKQITMVALPKSTALTMLLSGSIGYAPAVNAYDDGSSVVLSAGGVGSPDGNISIGSTTFGNRLNATATGSLVVAPTAGDSGTGAAGGITSFANFTTLFGAKSVTLTADHGSAISTALGINLNSSDPATAGSVTIEALGASGLSPAGQMTFTGGLYANAASTDFDTGDGTIGADGLGGTVILRANGGNIAADYISLDVSGAGAGGTQRGGEGYGGSVIVSAGYGGSITTGSTSLYATGLGGAGYGSEGGPSGFGGDGHGGSIALHDFGTELGTDALGGTLALGDVYLNASADGGYTYDIGAGHGGNAFGGTVDVALNKRNQIFSAFYANADAHDGDTSIDPMGGTVNLTVGGGITVNVASDMYLTANAVAGVNGGPGAIGQGGTVNLTVNGGASLYAVGSFYGQARADVAVPFGGLPIDSSPNLVGGTVNVLADGGTFHARDFYIDVGASNIGAGTLAGSATGGTVSLGADNGGSLYTAPIGGAGGFFNVLANGLGSNGAKANVARGGTVNLFAKNGGTVTAFGATINIGAAAGDDSYAPDTSGVGVDAFGGTVNVDALGGTIQSGVGANVTASGGSADGDAGDGVAGDVHVRSLGGTLSGLLNVATEGNGGQSLVAGDGGDGRGGSLTLLSDAAATYLAFDLNFLSESAGGSATAGAGGDGYGGRAQIDVLGGTHTWTDVFMRGDSYGAPSLGAGSLGGSAFGDPAGLNFHVGGAALTISNGMALNASAIAGDSGGPPAQAIGGKIAVDVDGGTISTNGLSGIAYAQAGYAPDIGGTARGGTVSFDVRNGGAINAAYLSAVADAYGGYSDDIGGVAIGGTASLTSLGGILGIGSVDLEAEAYGGDGPNAGGVPTGGMASLLLDGGTYNWNNLQVSAGAHASNGGGGSGAIGLADAVDVSLLNAAALTVTGGIVLSADAYGSFDPPADAVVHGGGINLSLTGDSSLAFGSLSATAQAIITAPFFGGGPSSTPDTVGGTIALTANGSTLSGQSVGLSADAYQLGALNNAGTAQGGSVAMNLLNGSSLTLTSGEGGSGLNLSASGFGALGDSAADAMGGSATLTVSDSTVNVAGAIDVAALGRANDYAILTPAGSNLTGFDATGGTAAVTVASSGSGSASLIATSLSVDASADASTPEFYAYGGESFPSGYYGGPFAADGGTGTGGTATLNLGGGTSNIADATVTADGFGGISAASYSGTAFRSGDGRGGTAAVIVSGGTNAFPALTVSAVGHGGIGSPPGDVGSLPALAGDGFGGTASLTSSGGALQADALAIDATGYGGTGGDGPDDSSLTPATDGGVGTGGTARLVSMAGGNGTLTLPAFTMTATGIGGTGGDAAFGADGNGGNGIGGTAAAQLADGAFSLGPVLLNADGIGGDGATGGEGSGGTAQFTLIDTTGPSGARAMGSLSLHASGVSGTSATGPVAATDAGSTGLDVEVGSAAAALVVDGDFEALARGSRAASGDGFTGKTTGTLFRINGNANIDTPRDVTIAAPGVIFASGGFTSLSRSFTETGLVSASSSVAITAPEGISADQLRTDNGTTTLLATNGAITVANLTSFGDVTALGRSIHISDGGRLNVASAQATAGDLFIHASGNLTLQSASATGAMDFAGNKVTANSALAPGGGFSASGTNGVTLTSLNSGGSATLTSANGAVSASGDVTSAGSFMASGKTGVSFGNLTSGGTTSLTSGSGNIAVTNLTSAGLVTAIGATVTLQGPGPLSFANAQATAGNLNIVSPGNLTFAQAGASGTVNLTSSAGSLTATGPITAGGAVNLLGLTGLNLAAISSGGTTSLSASNGAIVATNLTSAGDVTASARSIDIGSSGALSFANAQASAGNLRVIASGKLVFAQASATGTIAMTSSAGSLSATGPISAGGAVNLFGATGMALGSLTSGGTTLINGGSGALTVTSLTSPGAVTALGGSLDISSPGGLTFDQARATSGDLKIRTAGDLTGSLLSANRDIRLTAGGTFRLTGQALGANITVTSGDIAIGSTARLGARGTTGEMSLFNGSPSQEAFIGGAPQAEAYSLDSGEITRLFADRGITIGIAGSELSSNQGHMTVGDLALTFGAGSANIGTGGFLEISTPTKMSIVGNVALTTSSADDQFIVDPARVELKTDTGSIAMLDSSGNPLGQLHVTGGTIAMGTAATLDQLALLTDFTAINALLDQPGGKADSLRAGTMSFDVVDGFYIQNTGASTATDARRGFAANGLSITTASPSTRISINGVILQGGTPATGLATAPLVTINGSPPAAGGKFDPLSTINGCALGTSCGAPPPETRPDYTPPPNDEIEPPVTPGNPGEGAFSATLIQLQDNEPLISPPLVDEPITGVGNDDLWVPECPDGQQEGCPQQDGAK